MRSMKQRQPRVIRACLFGVFLVLLHLPLNTDAAGVTFITHGFELLPGKPGWVSAMANQIAARAGGSTAVYEMTVAKVHPSDPFDNTLQVASFVLTAGSPPTTIMNSEVVVEIYWDQVANPENAN